MTLKPDKNTIYAVQKGKKGNTKVVLQITLVI